jgi:hypothetical protein
LNSALIYYNAGVLVINLEVVGLAAGLTLFRFDGQVTGTLRAKKLALQREIKYFDEAGFSASYDKNDKLDFFPAGKGLFIFFECHRKKFRFTLSFTTKVLKGNKSSSESFPWKKNEIICLHFYSTLKLFVERRFLLHLICLLKANRGVARCFSFWDPKFVAETFYAIAYCHL